MAFWEVITGFPVVSSIRSCVPHLQASGFTVLELFGGCKHCQNQSSVHVVLYSSTFSFLYFVATTRGTALSGCILTFFRTTHLHLLLPGFRFKSLQYRRGFSVPVKIAITSTIASHALNFLMTSIPCSVLATFFVFFSSTTALSHFFVNSIHCNSPLFCGDF